MIAIGFPKAFGVWFRQVDRFDPASFERISWHWSEEVMAPIASVLKPRKEKVDRSKFAFSDLQPITIHFDGSIDKREVDHGRDYSMDLFFAYPGDIVVAKIDLKNGAVGLVPAWQNIVVTNHFAVYEPDRSKVVPEYFLRLIQTSFFKSYLWRNKVGAEGRKEVKLDFFESIEIPLPPLDVQQAIVAHWQAAQKSIQKTDDIIHQLENDVPRIILELLGIPYYENKELPKVFSCSWSNLQNFGVGYTARAISSSTDLHESRFLLKKLGEIAHVSYGIQKSPANRPGKNAKPYLRVANVQKGQLDLSEIKYIDVADGEMEALRLQKGDLLVCEGNSADLVGRPAIWNDEIPNCVHQNHILKVRVNADAAIPKYILEYIQTLPARTYFRGRAKFTTHLASINSNDLRELPVPLPALDVQQSIIQKTQITQAEIARLRERAAQIREQAEAEIEALILGTRLPRE